MAAPTEAPRGTKSADVRAALVADPGRRDAVIAREVGCDARLVARIRRTLPSPPEGSLEPGPIHLSDWLEVHEATGALVFRVSIRLETLAGDSTVVDLGHLRGDDVRAGLTGGMMLANRIRARLVRDCWPR